MPDSTPDEIIQAEESIKADKTEEALAITRTFMQTAWSYFYKGDYDKALEIGLQSNELIEKVGEEIDVAHIFLLLGWVYSLRGDTESSLDYGMKSIDFHKKLNLQQTLASSYYLVGVNNANSNNFGLAISYFEQALFIKEILPRNKAEILSYLANIFFIKGDISQSLKCSEEGLQLAKTENLSYLTAQFLSNIGIFNAFMKNFHKAKEYYKKALDFAEKKGIIIVKGITLFQLIMISVEENSMDQARYYLDLFRKFMEQRNEKIFLDLFSLSRGMVLYQSSRTRDRAEAESLFKQIVDVGLSNYGHILIYSYALYGLVFIYIEELRVSNDTEILNDIKPLISILFKFAEQYDSTLYLTQGKIFQARVEVILMNIDKAKKLLTEAQKLAESSNIGFYAHLISNEHDRLLEYQEKMERSENVRMLTSERMRLASLEGIANITQGEQSEASLETQPETPVFLLIISESGVPLFSYSFSKELSFEDDIISSFISAFNTFSGELFSKGLDRARFGEYIILLESIDSYSVCYLFKGQSYPAKQKLTNFIENIQKTSTIWQTLEKFLKTSQVADLQDLPQIEKLINEIFIK
ncbi:MAG: tetratricopeptide repeat protein [Promethearchaeota archaeon]|jgi:tetratricopeptide (TPR) repeat protein